MGGKIVVPEPDANIRKVVKNFFFTPKDISDFWKIFQRLDKEQSGLVPLSNIFKSFEMERNLFTDCLLELLEIEHDVACVQRERSTSRTSCWSSPPTASSSPWRFSNDKAGFFSIDDLNNLVNVVHNVRTGSTVKGAVKGSWMRLTFQDDQINFEDFVKIHTAFPRLFEPAFRLQQLMMIHTMGEVWWTLKKRSLQDMKEENLRKIQRIEAKKEKKKQDKKNRKIQRNMGLIKYYLCPCYRADYDPSRTAYDKLSQAEKEEWDRQVALKKREAELKLKNPETVDWMKFQKRLEKIEEEGVEKDEKAEKDVSAEDKAMEPAVIIAEQKIVMERAVAKDSKSDPDSKALPLVPLSTSSDDILAKFSTTGQLDDAVLLSTPAEEKRSRKKHSYLEVKHLSTARPREERAMNREERRRQRKQILQEL
eukprot:scaffold7160_cov156-Ochromonas_danica.AAC.12